MLGAYQTVPESSPWLGLLTCTRVIFKGARTTQATSAWPGNKASAYTYSPLDHAARMVRNELHHA